MIVHIRTWTKFTILIILAAFLMVGAVSYIYKPIYSVTLNGEFVGYSENKSKLQEKINNYIENGNGENVAFVEINELPEYKLCLLKKNISTNDEEIYNKVIENGKVYYKYYAINLGDFNYQVHEPLRKNCQIAMTEDFKFMEFGTRRRYSFDVQDAVCQYLSRKCANCVGTSNVYFAKKYGLKPMGTMAHEMFMATAAVTSPKEANHIVMENWSKVYDGNLGTVLTDTYTVGSKVKEMFKELLKKPKFIFNKLYKISEHNKQEVVTAFTGLLELSRRSKVKTTQEELFGDIIVEKAKKAS